MVILLVVLLQGGRISVLVLSRAAMSLLTRRVCATRIIYECAGMVGLIQFAVLNQMSAGSRIVPVEMASTSIWITLVIQRSSRHVLGSGWTIILKGIGLVLPNILQMRMSRSALGNVLRSGLALILKGKERWTRLLPKPIVLLSRVIRPPVARECYGLRQYGLRLSSGLLSGQSTLKQNV